MDIREIKELSASELEKAIKEPNEALFNLRFQHSINQLENPMKIVETKKTIARMLTVLREKQLAENA
jgi:large subunit ribosomal protein L29